MHNEKSVKDAVKRRLKKHNAWYTMPNQAGFSQRGVPDILACCNGVFIGIECKFGKNKPTALQEQQLEAIQNAKGVSLVVHENNLKSLEAVLEAVSGARDIRKFVLENL